MDTITLQNIKTYAYHGCLKEERSIGSNYRIDISVTADLKKSSKTDNLKDTVDYATLSNIILREMKIPSNLLEHVAERISKAILELKQVEKVSISVAKLNPPVNADIESVCVNITRETSITNKR